MKRADQEVDEENVLGIPVADPSVLKATQVVLVSVAVTGFVLALSVIHVVERRGLKGLTRFEETLWVMDASRALVMTVAGYLGARTGSAMLLGLFWVLSIVSVFTTGVIALGSVAQGAEIGSGAQQLLVAVLFAAGAHQSWFLWGKAKEGSLFSAQTGGSGREAYVMLGMPMMDLKVLRATQMLFTSLAIIVYTFGSVVVIGADDALNGGSFRILWLICVVLVTSLSFTSYYGIKRSHAGMLKIFCGVCGIFCGLSGLTTLSTVLTCGGGCAALDLFSVGLTLVFAVALRNGWYLMTQAASGKALTAQDAPEETVVTGTVPPTQLGAHAGEARKGQLPEEPVKPRREEV